MKIVGVSLLSAVALATPAFAEPLAQPTVEKAVIMACADWFAKRDWNGPVEIQPVTGGLCFNGTIALGDDKKLTTALAAYPSDQSIVMVARSGGGDTSTGIAMGEALTGRPVTMVAYQICGSSCANFLLSSGRRKVVVKGSLLLFHGSINMDHLNLMAEQARKQITDMGAQHPELAKDDEAQIGIVVEQSRTQLAGLIVRQEALLEKQDISPSLFRWMDLFNHMTQTERLAHCQMQPHMIVYPTQVLAQFGYKIDAYEGPVSQAEVDSDVTEQKLGKPMCYWRP